MRETQSLRVTLLICFLVHYHPDLILPGPTFEENLDADDAR